MLSKGRGRWAVSQKPKLIRNCYLRAKRTTIKIHQNFFLFYSFCALRLLGLVCVQTTPPLKKIGERLLPEYFLGEGPSVHRLGLVIPSSVASNRTEMAKNTTKLNLAQRLRLCERSYIYYISLHFICSSNICVRV